MPTDAHGIPKHQSTTDKLRKSISEIMKRPICCDEKHLVFCQEVARGSLADNRNLYRELATPKNAYSRFDANPFGSV